MPTPQTDAVTATMLELPNVILLWAAAKGLDLSALCTRLLLEEWQRQAQTPAPPTADAAP